MKNPPGRSVSHQLITNHAAISIRARAIELAKHSASPRGHLSAAKLRCPRHALWTRELSSPPLDPLLMGILASSRLSIGGEGSVHVDGCFD